MIYQDRVPQDRYSDLLRLTAKHAWIMARRESRHSGNFVDRVVMEPGELSPEELLLILLQFDEGRMITTEHLGDPQIKPDIVVHAEIEAYVKKFWPRGTLVGGEEVFGKVMNLLDSAPDGTLAINADPIDGSRLYRTLRFGWCVALQLLVKVGEEWRHECAIIVGSDGKFITSNRDWLVSSGEFAFGAHPPEEEVLTHLGPRNPLDAPSLAIVAVKPLDALLFLPLMWALHQDGWYVDTVGGNPIALGFATGDLCASMTLRPSTTWDTVWVPLVSSLGAVAATLGGEEVTRNVVRDWYNSISVGSEALVVPPIVVAREECMDDLLAQVRRVELARYVALSASGEKPNAIQWILDHERLK